MSRKGFPGIFVKGLPQECTKTDIRNWFSEFGRVEDIVYKYGADANRVKGIAFVHFENQEIVDELIEKKFITVEEEEHKLEIRKPKEIEGKDKEDPKTSIPKEALKCYICKKGRFPTPRTFFNHIHGKQHQVLAKMVRAKSASVLQLLKAESKLASDRLYDMKWVKENPSEERPYCDLCQVQINYNPIRHEKSAEHKMVVSYMNKKCCDIDFTDRFKYENHLLSLPHLKTAYEKEQQRKLEKSDERLTMKKAIDIYKQCDQDLKELKEKYVDLDLNEELPPFDNQPIGLNHIVKKINYYCICCDQKFFANINFVKPHCRSYNHYSNMVDFITDIEKENEKRRLSKKKENRFSNDKDIEDIEIKKRDREDGKEDSEESAPKKLKTEGKDGESTKDDDGNEEEEDTKDHHDEDYEMHEVEDAENEEDEEEGFGHGDSEEEQEDEHEEEHEEEQEEEQEEIEEEQEEHEEDHDEEQEQEVEEEEEEEEESMHKDEEAQEEVCEDTENPPEEDDEVQVLDQEETETTEKPQEEDEEEENSGEVPVQETKEEEEEEEEEVVEIPKRKATRGRRGRGRGRNLRR